MVVAPLAERERDGRRRRDRKARAGSGALASVERVAVLVADPPGEVPTVQEMRGIGDSETATVGGVASLWS